MSNHPSRSLASYTFISYDLRSGETIGHARYPRNLVRQAATYRDTAGCIEILEIPRAGFEAWRDQTPLAQMRRVPGVRTVYRDALIPELPPVRLDRSFVPPKGSRPVKTGAGLRDTLSTIITNAKLIPDPATGRYCYAVPVSDIDTARNLLGIARER